MKIILTIVWILVPVLMIYSQALSGPGCMVKKIPRGYAGGYLILNDSSRLDGWIRNNIRHWSSVKLIQQDGTKTIWTASQLREAVIGGLKFLCIDSDWYHMVESGPRINLLKLASSEQDEIQYNGTEPVGIGRSTGSFGDYFFQFPDRPDLLIRVAENNVAWEVKQNMGVCEAVVDAIKDRKVDLKEIPELVRTFNNCKEKK